MLHSSLNVDDVHLRFSGRRLPEIGAHAACDSIMPVFRAEFTYKISTPANSVKICAPGDPAYFRRPAPDAPLNGADQISTSVSHLSSIMLMTHHLVSF